MLLAGFEPAIPASDRPQTLAVDGSATGIVPLQVFHLIIKNKTGNVCRAKHFRRSRLTVAKAASTVATGGVTPVVLDLAKVPV